MGEEELSRGRQVVTAAIARIQAGDFRPDPKSMAGTCISWFGCPGPRAKAARTAMRIQRGSASRVANQANCNTKMPSSWPMKD